jgi:hypothetical protein
MIRNGGWYYPYSVEIQSKQRLNPGSKIIMGRPPGNGITFTAHHRNIPIIWKPSNTRND